MRHVYTIMLAALLGGIAAQAQKADYQPLVREGVRWVNNSQFIHYGDETYYGPIGTDVLQFCGDSVIAQHASIGNHVTEEKPLGDVLIQGKMTIQCPDGV